MKKIYSILALAAFMFGAEANAQRITFDSKATVAEINAFISESTDMFAEIDVTKVTTDLTGEEIVSPNPNTIIIAKSYAQVANKTNVVFMDNNGKYQCADFVITDGYPFTSNIEIDLAKLTYKRRVYNEFSTLILPMCFEYENQSSLRPNQKFEVVDEVCENIIKCKPLDKTDFNVSTLGLHHVDAGVPMIVHLHDFDASKENYIIIEEEQGCVNKTSAITWPASVYTLSGKYVASTLSPNDENVCYIQDNKFWAVSDFGVEVSVPAYRCVFTPNTPNVKSFSIVSVEDESTAIKSVATSTTSTEAYNLQGVRVAPTAKGFVIMNGKKYFNK